MKERLRIIEGDDEELLHCFIEEVDPDFPYTVDEAADRNYSRLLDGKLPDCRHW